MRQWLETERGHAAPNGERFLDEGAIWLAEGVSQPFGTLIEQLKAVRKAQIDLLPRFPIPAWETVHTPIPIYGPVTLSWVVTKTLQHTAEHTHDVLRLVLFWDWTPQDATSAASGASAAPRDHTPG